MGIWGIILERLVLLSVLAIPLLFTIVIFRSFFSNITKRYVLILWAVLALRLICPVIITNPFSILPVFSEEAVKNVLASVTEELSSSASFLGQDGGIDSLQQVEKEQKEKESLAISEQGKEAEDVIFAMKTKPEDTLASDKQETQEDSLTLSGQETKDKMAVNGEQTVSDRTAIFPIIWITVCGLLWGYGLFRGIFLRRKLQDAVPLEKGVYGSGRIKEPFALGVVKPRIYLPSGMAEEHKEAVLSHEREHIRHQDTRINVFAYLLVSVYWFSPVILAAYFLFLTDLEMACDERVVSHLDGRKKQRYASALLACGSGHLFPRFYPVAFGESGVSKRIHNIIKGKVLPPRAGKGMLVLVVLLSLCFGSGCEQLVLDKESNNSQSQPVQTSSFQGANQRTIAWQEDVTGDKKPDAITVDVSALTDEKGEILSAEGYKGDGKEKTVRVTSGQTGEELYSVNINTVKHRGGLYLYKKKLSHLTSVDTEKTFFLLWEPPASAKEENYHYEIFSLSEQGEKKIEEEGTFTREEKLIPSRGNRTYLEQVNEYLFHSVVLLDTVGGIAQYGEVEKQMTLLYDAQEDCSKPIVLGAARDTIEESDFIRIKSDDGWSPLQSDYPGIPFYVAYQEEWQCDNHRFRVYFHYEDKDTKFFGYRNEEEIEAKEGEEKYGEDFVLVNSWEIKPGWAPYIIWSPPSYTDYKERADYYYVTAYVVDEQETKLLAKQTIAIGWEWHENSMKLKAILQDAISKSEGAGYNKE